MGAFRAHPTAWWLVAFPALFVALTASSAALLGDAMRDAADPRLRGG
jgi:ABC-type dipeptide/oligopeptide/nickel transport system permease subunit